MLQVAHKLLKDAINSRNNYTQRISRARDASSLVRIEPWHAKHKPSLFTRTHAVTLRRNKIGGILRTGPPSRSPGSSKGSMTIHDVGAYRSLSKATQNLGATNFAGDPEFTASRSRRAHDCDSEVFDVAVIRKPPL
ncbi:hypothetical protein MRX96_038085 [Rhipicephalus microplus]